MRSIADVLASLGRGGGLTDGRPMCPQCNVQPMNRVGLLCAPCQRLAATAHRRAMLSAAYASIPPAYRNLDTHELARRTRLPEAVVREARGALGRPRVVLVGAAGIGKTSLACWMLTAILENAPRGPVLEFHRARRARFVDAGALCKAVREHPLGQGEASVLSGALGASVCVLDDVGVELQMRMASNPVVDVIRERHAAGKATWITTFLTPEAFERAYGSGTTRRVFDGATVLCIEGGS